MGKAFEGQRHTVEGVTRIEQRRIEGLAIEGDQRPRRRQEVPKPFQHSRLLGRVAHEELLQEKLPFYKTPDADQKGIGPGAARKAAGLGVQKGKRIQGQVGQQNELRELYRALMNVAKLAKIVLK